MQKKLHVRPEAAPEKIPRASIGNTPLAEGRAGIIARALEHKKVCVVLDPHSFEGAFAGLHVVLDYNSRLTFNITPETRVSDLMLDSCLTLTNLAVFMRMLAPGHTRTEDHHENGGTVQVPVGLKKDLIALDSYEALPVDQFAVLKSLLTDFRARNPNSVIVASYARRPVLTPGAEPELDRAATDALETETVRQLDALFDASLIDHVEAPKHKSCLVPQLDLMCRGAQLVEKRHRIIDAQLASHEAEAHASPDDPQECVMVEPPAE